MKMSNKEITKINLALAKEADAKLKTMSGDDLKSFLAKMALFGKYSLSNQYILAIKGCNKVAGFKKWQEEGRIVKKGAKAVWILAPLVGKDKEDEKKQKVFGFQSIPVFDIAETEELSLA